ncbi:MAG: peptidoglycan-binding domain-containing protein [Phycicoccus sp.]
MSTTHVIRRVVRGRHGTRAARVGAEVNRDPEVGAGHGPHETRVVRAARARRAIRRVRGARRGGAVLVTALVLGVTTYAAGTAFAGTPTPASSLLSSGCPELIRQGHNDSRCVVRLQILLGRAGHSVTVDGDFGLRTHSAVRSYQSRYGLTVDGIVGSRTKSSLESRYGSSGGSSSSSRISQSSAESQLRAAGVTWSSSGGCTIRSNPSCTSLEQVRQLSVTRVIDLKEASRCAVNVTGGTEVGHAGGTYSHYNGYKIDVTRSSCVTGYVTRTFTRIGTRGDGAAQWRSAAGNVYADEGDHWDITYTG